MENLKNLPPFYVGQKVVATKDHSQLLILKGQEFEIKDIKRAPCCGKWIVSVGMANNGMNTRCKSCRGTYFNSQIFFSYTLFSPIQQQKFPLIKLTKVIEKEKQLVSAN